jgi:hypothetical protein
MKMEILLLVIRHSDLFWQTNPFINDDIYELYSLQGYGIYNDN